MRRVWTLPVAGWILLGCLSACTGEIDSNLRGPAEVFIVRGEIGALHAAVQINFHNGFTCTGTLLSSNAVLTAAHCVFGCGSECGGSVYAGQLPDKPTVEIDPARVFLYPEYDNTTGETHDVAVVGLARPIAVPPWTDTYVAIARTRFPDDRLAWLNGQKVADVIQPQNTHGTVRTAVLPASDPRYPYQLLNAGERQNEGGDSGGPLFLEDISNGELNDGMGGNLARPHLFGIVQRGGCYARLDPVADWIEARRVEAQTPDPDAEERRCSAYGSNSFVCTGQSCGYYYCAGTDSCHAPGAPLDRACPSGGTALVNGQQDALPISPRGVVHYYTFAVGTGQGSMTIETYGGPGDANLYVRHGAPPTLDLWDYRPFASDSNERVEVTAPAAGTWHILIVADDEFNGVYVRATAGGTSAYCGDGHCGGGESCSNCAADCGACPASCGDGTCSGTETCSTCPGDCGQCDCPPPPTPGYPAPVLPTGSCRAHDASVSSCNAAGGCSYYLCANACLPTGTALGQVCPSQCRGYDGNSSGCGAVGGCAYFTCNSQCWPAGTPVGQLCPSECRARDGNVSACNAVGGCAYYLCSNQCHPTGTTQQCAGCP